MFLHNTKKFFAKHTIPIAISIIILCQFVILSFVGMQNADMQDVLDSYEHQEDLQAQAQKDLNKAFMNSDKQMREDHQLQQRYLNCLVILLRAETRLDGQTIVNECQKRAEAPIEADDESLFQRSELDNIRKKQSEKPKRSSQENPSVQPKRQTIPVFDQVMDFLGEPFGLGTGNNS